MYDIVCQFKNYLGHCAWVEGDKACQVGDRIDGILNTIGTAKGKKEETKTNNNNCGSPEKTSRESPSSSIQPSQQQSKSSTSSSKRALKDLSVEEIIRLLNSPKVELGAYT